VAAESEEAPLIDEIADANTWSRAMDAVTNWLNDQLITTDTLIELAIIAAAATLAW
jgi:hypothetical protein